MNETYHMLFTAILRPRNSKKTIKNHKFKKVLILAGVEPAQQSVQCVDSGALDHSAT